MSCSPGFKLLSENTSSLFETLCLVSGPIRVENYKRASDLQKFNKKMELCALSKKKPWLVLAYNIVSAIDHVISETTLGFIMTTYLATCILKRKIIFFYLCALKICILLLAWLIDGSRIWFDFSRRDWLISRQPAQLAPHYLSIF